VTRPRVVVAGLGPAGPEYVTAAVTEAIQRVSERYVRTARHPSAPVVGAAETFDHLYETATTFDEVYVGIADALAGAAAEHGEVLYAVPGSPWVLERSVRHLLDDERIECTVLPALSFLDLVWDRLRIDPIGDGVRLVDGLQFATDAAGERGPLLVAHCHADWVLSDIKLAVDDFDGPVVILQRLGCPDETVTTTTWSDLDRTVTADHLTSIYVPALAAPVGQELVRFHQLARTLREQCPWDVEQTHASLVPHLLEEAYEVVDAIQALDPEDPATDDELLEELGDLLYQVEFHATIAEHEGRFTMADVARGIHDKLVRRHPHVFGDVDVDGTGQVLANWDAIKRAEKGRSSVFDGIPSALPALAYAAKVQKKAAAVGFDWPDVDGALPKIAEEAAEVVAAVGSGEAAAVADEVGDLLFAVVNVARHLHVDPEAALRAAVTKFRRRFESVERLAAERGIDLHTAGLTALDALWDEVKSPRSGPRK
jgi:tetrapyrrole methylase family protein/MazG family protein